jgi:hypothetical protein
MHNWNLTQCDRCGFICEHEFDGPSCIKCGYTSGGIDNAICINYDGTDYYVPYSASFYDFLVLYIGVDYSESTREGYWVAITPYGEFELYEFTALCELGSSFTVELRKNGEGTEGDPDSCAHWYYNGSCEYCGAPCPHPMWKEGYCAYCNYECHHESMYGGVCDFCGYSCNHDFENGCCMLCGSHSSELGGTITVYYNGGEYEIAMDTTVARFVSDYLGLDFEMTTGMGFWTLYSDYDSGSVMPSGDSYFCDYGGALYLEYTEYAMGPF